MLLLRPRLFSTATIIAIAATTLAIRFLRLRLQSTSEETSEDMKKSNSFSLILCNKYAKEDGLSQTLKSKWNKLKILSDEENEEISILHFSEMDSIVQMTFNRQMYMDGLSTEYFGCFVIWSPCLPSTHDLVSQNFCYLPAGSVCVADIQFKGRGRVKNVWESPLGCLMFSFIVQMDDGHKLPLLQYVVSLALTEAIKEACQVKGLPNLDVRIKWPNDLYLNGFKVGGILCTSTYRNKRFDVCAGIGLNVDNEKPTTCLNSVLQDLCTYPSSNKLSREDILSGFFNKFEELFKIFLNQGFQVLEDLYCSTWLHSGQKVDIEENHNDKITKTSVTIMGLTPSGYLLAIDEDGKSFELHPDGNRRESKGDVDTSPYIMYLCHFCQIWSVTFSTICSSISTHSDEFSVWISLDFFQGLVKRKIP